MSSSSFVKSLHVTALDFAAMRGYKRSRPSLLNAAAINIPEMGSYVYENPQVNYDPNGNTYKHLNINGASPLITNETRDFIFQKDVQASIQSGINVQKGHQAEQTQSALLQMHAMGEVRSQRYKAHDKEITQGVFIRRAAIESYKQHAAVQKEVSSHKMMTSISSATLDQIPGLKVRI